MDVKQAVRTAINYVKEVFAEEELTNLGLEEVEYVPERGEWRVTVGFSRPWQQPWQQNLLLPQVRDYKVVNMEDTTGRVLAIRNRLMPEPAAV